MDSILTSIKKLLGIEEDYTHFDPDLIIMINSALSILRQIGVGTPGIEVMDKTLTWAEFLGGTSAPFDAVKSYVHLKVCLMFDPPQNSAVIESINRMISEYEWRILVYYDPPFAETVVEDGSAEPIL